MATRTMKGPEPLYRLKVVSEVTKRNPEYTGYGCGHPRHVGTGELRTLYYGPYIRRHAALSMRGIVSHAFTVSADVETCQPTWEGEAL